MTSGADVRPLVEPRAGPRERRAEFNDRGVMTRGDRAAEKRAPEILTGQARDERQQLRRRLDRAIAADKRRPQGERRTRTASRRRAPRAAPPPFMSSRTFTHTPRCGGRIGRGNRAASSPYIALDRGQALVERQGGLDAAPWRVPRARRVASPFDERALDGAGQRADAAARHDQPVPLVFGDLRRAAGRGRDERRFERHRLEHRIRRAFVVRRLRVEIERVVKRRRRRRGVRAVRTRRRASAAPPAPGARPRWLPAPAMNRRSVGKRSRSAAHASISTSNRFCGSSRPMAPTTMSSGEMPSAARAPASSRRSRRNARWSMPLSTTRTRSAAHVVADELRLDLARDRNRQRERAQHLLVERVVQPALARAVPGPSVGGGERNRALRARRPAAPGGRSCSRGRGRCRCRGRARRAAAAARRARSNEPRSTTST